MKHTLSKQAYQHAVTYLPGGVNSPVRSFQAVKTSPIFIDHASGSEIVDIDQNTYIDYIGSWGPMILGHNAPIFQTGMQEAFARGVSYGLPTTLESDVAQWIIDAYPSIDMIRMVNSGTEATMSALRSARGYTKRDKFIKFEGCYHGHSDALLVKSGSGTLTFGTPTSLGVPKQTIQDTLVCVYNDIASVQAMIEAFPKQIAAIIIEPIAANMGLVPARKDFLVALRNLCDEHNIILIFDEVISGFRIAYGGAAAYYDVQPDMVCFGKIIGGGMPVGAYGGRKAIMQMISPLGPVYQAGTLSGNPFAMWMGITQLRYLKEHPEVYDYIDTYAKQLAQGIDAILKRHQLPYQVQCCGSLLTIFFTKVNIENFNDVQTSDEEAFARYFQSMLEQGILVAPSPYEAMFISYAHTQGQLHTTLQAMEIALVKSQL